MTFTDNAGGQACGDTLYFVEKASRIIHQRLIMRRNPLVLLVLGVEKGCWPRDLGGLATPDYCGNSHRINETQAITDAMARNGDKTVNPIMIAITTF